jgi:hypothetical protein
MSRSIRAIPLLLWLALPSFAQNGWVTGTITIDGAPSSACIMKLEGVEVPTDEGGCYFFDHVAPGRHELSFEVEGLMHWDELYADAVNCLRFDSNGRASSNPEYIRFCEEHGYDADEYSEVAYRALSIIRGDSRAHALMLQALKAEDDVIVALAVDGLAEQLFMK